MSERPGTMIYFDDLLPLFDIINDEEIGHLFKAVVMYGKFGEVPTFSNSPALAIAWGFIRPKIDRDGKKYEQEIFQRRYAVYCREIKKHGNDPVPFNEWYREISDDSIQYPTVNASETGAANISETGAASENSSSTGAADGDGGGIGEGNVGRGTGEPSPPTPTPGRAEKYFREMISDNPSDASMDHLARLEAAVGTELCIQVMDEAKDSGEGWAYIRKRLISLRDGG